MSFRVLQWVGVGFGLSLLSACMTAPTAQPCATPLACEVAQLIAADMQGQAGRDLGGGVYISQVQAAGSLVVTDMVLPIAASGLAPIQKQIAHDLATRSFVAGFCSEEDVQQVFGLGNAYQLRTFGADGASMGVSTLRSCEG